MTAENELPFRLTVGVPNISQTPCADIVTFAFELTETSPSADVLDFAAPVTSMDPSFFTSTSVPLS